MLIITIPADEIYDEDKQEFITVTKEQTLKLEHSLVSLSKWESKWHKSFMSSDKTVEEMNDYIRCMTVTSNVDPKIYRLLTEDNIVSINDYIRDPMTATVITSKDSGNSGKEVLTAELLYYYMIALNIPFECQTWHLNRLITLIRVCNVKNQPPKKMGKREIMSRNAALNAARRKQYNSRG